jgi:predicted N-formylglutamate amidohydrolase
MRYTGVPELPDHRPMHEDGAESIERETFLAADEPLPCRVRNPASTANAFLVCDHASCRLPRALGDLGLDQAARRSHLAWDIGAGALTERLSDSLALTAVLANYSRLVVDCNRELLDPGAFLELGDGLPIPGNRNLTDEHKKSRADAIYWPYHHALDLQVKRIRSHTPLPTFLAIHSFAPVLDAVSRPWEVGILWDKDRATAELLIQEFSRVGLRVGDNEPYSGKAPQDFTIDHHAEPAGVPHAGIEIRQDLISDPRGVERMVAVIVPIFRRIMARVSANAGGHGEMQQPV